MPTAYRTALTGLLLLSVTFVSFGQTRKSRRPTSVGTVPQQQKSPQLECREFNHSYAITTKYDRFADETTTRLVIKPVEEQTSIADLYFYFTYPGQRFLKPPSVVTFTVEEYSSPSEGTSTSLVILTDKERLAGMMRSNYTHDPLVSGWLAERIISLRYPTFLQLASSQSAEMRIGSEEFRLSDEMLEAIRDFACHTNPNPVRSANNSIAGTWALQFAPQQGSPGAMLVLMIREAGGKYECTAGGEAIECSVTGNSFRTTQRNVPIKGQIVEANITGTLVGDSIRGKLTLTATDGTATTSLLTGTRMNP
jgi:hypothetical protein